MNAKVNLIPLDARIETEYCINNDIRDQHMAYAMQHISQRLAKGFDRGPEPVALVCLGPSLLNEWQQLKNYKYIISCSGSHQFLIDRGIVPTWHVEVDPRDHKVQLLGDTHPDVEYLVASVCHPRYIDYVANRNVKLWHILIDTEVEELPNVYPRGEWVFTGGSNAGLRALVIARFLGFRNVHVFGMDCSYPQGHTGEHAIAHPMPADSQDRVVTEYKGLFYHTTGRLIHYAREFFHEIDMLGDMQFKLFGQGLLQHMVHAGYHNEKGHQIRDKSVIAMTAPCVITPDYREQNRLLHETNPHYGAGGQRYVNMALYLTKEFGTQDLLDYGCGKGTLAHSLPFNIKEYDPAIAGKDLEPRPADIVMCTDVLEHVEPELIKHVLGDIARVTRRVVFFVISTVPAIKTLPDGRNTHLIQQGRAWWYKHLEEFFHIQDLEENSNSITVLAKPKSSVHTLSDIDNLSHSVTCRDFEGVKYADVNSVTKWRAETVRTKEPITYQWIHQLQESDVLVDVGANVGTYSLMAAVKRRCRVYAFEPESLNYSVLNQNILLNKVQDRVKAYCLCVGDRNGTAELQLSSFNPGTSGHQMTTGHRYNIKSTDFQFAQGTFSVTLDSLVASGSIPQPTHIKIDVDGLESQVISGATNTLSGVKSLIVEVDTRIDAHNAMIQYLERLGFTWDPAQVADARRTEGTFKGVAEYVFSRQ